MYILSKYKTFTACYIEKKKLGDINKCESSIVKILFYKYVVSERYLFLIYRLEIHYELLQFGV